MHCDAAQNLWHRSLAGLRCYLKFSKFAMSSLSPCIFDTPDGFIPDGVMHDGVNIAPAQFSKIVPALLKTAMLASLCGVISAF